MYITKTFFKMGRKRIYFTPEERRLAVNARVRFLTLLRKKNDRVFCDCQGTYTYSIELQNQEPMRLIHEETKRHIRFLKGLALTEKYCKSCKTTKPANEFYITREYLQARCKPCHNIFRRESREKAKQS